jgi:hypothetical protein
MICGARALTVLSLTVLAACGGGGNSSTAPYPLFWSVAVADIDGDGLPDVVATYSMVEGAPPHIGFVAVYLQDRTRPGTFLPAATYGAGDDPVSAAIGDLDGDGKADIVTTNAILSTNGAGASTVSVLLQDLANPGHFHAAARYATGVNPQSVAIGDLDGDGMLDLAVADDLGISLLFQNPAAPGTFLPHTPISVGNPTYSVSIADLNGDSKRDLVVTNAVSVLVLLQDPQMAGSFLAPASYSAGAQPIFASVGDLDGDGKPDLAVANLGSPSDPSTASVSVLLQNPAVPGSFLTSVTYATGLRSAAVAIADLNGDGEADLAVADSGMLVGPCPPSCGSTGARISVLLQNFAALGQFLSATNYPATGSDYISSVAIADMNGDGKADLIIAQYNGIVIRYQDPLHPGQFLAAAHILN